VKKLHLTKKSDRGYNFNEVAEVASWRIFWRKQGETSLSETTMHGNKN
jgi:hypothetical protein